MEITLNPYQTLPLLIFRHEALDFYLWIVLIPGAMRSHPAHFDMFYITLFSSIKLNDRKGGQVCINRPALISVCFNKAIRIGQNLFTDFGGIWLCVNGG